MVKKYLNLILFNRKVYIFIKKIIKIVELECKGKKERGKGRKRGSHGQPT